MNTAIYIENLKCGGCANTITKEVKALEGVTKVEVNVEDSLVNVAIASEDVLVTLKKKLSKLGYPEVGDTNSIMHKAKSFVSCAVGRVKS